MPKKAIIIGAGPAGLTAAYELLKRTDIVPIILEKDGIVGGISRTIDYKGNRMDMGPHRFFSKSDRVMNWWLNIMPLEEGVDKNATISYQNKARALNGESLTSPKDPDKVMLMIRRLTRVYFLRKFFIYPIQLSFETLRTLGLIRTIKILISFLWIKLFPRKPEKSLEDFIINKFGKQLYLLFFKDYTEKVWGIAPSQISAEWGAQRIKGVSLSKAIGQALKNMRNKKKGDIGQKGTETSLIEQFLYPKHGPGSLWEEVARQVQEMGGRIYFHQDVKRIHIEDGKVTRVNTINSHTSQADVWEADYFFSTMPVQEMIAGMGDRVPQEVQEVAVGLEYRDFINVGILLKKLSSKEGKTLKLKDNWIYIQERDVKASRLMIYNNWGGGMVKDPNNTWIGMEYFCNKTDAFWAESDEAIQKLAVQELGKMELAQTEDVLDVTICRMEKTYPAYFGTYKHFDKIKSFTDQFANLFLIGRNGMHKYNNADHSMLCAMVAVDNIEAGAISKANLWAINTEQEYHEQMQPSKQPVPTQKSLAPINTLSESFIEVFLSNRLNRTFLGIAITSWVIQFTFFKILYPYAGFLNGDSYVYLKSAYFNTDVNLYPIGYSKFLRLFSVFTGSDTALVAFQYLAIEVSALWLIFTLFLLFKPGKLTKWMMFSCVVFDPVFLYISNYVSSDSLFLALSLTWFTILLYLLYRPTWRLICWQVVVLFLAFTVRYNALYYPFITGLVLIQSRQPLKRKLIGILASVAVIFGFILFTASRYQQITGIWEFTPFTGWQLANNAMYAYRYVPDKNVQPTPAKFKNLDLMIRNYFDSNRDLRKHPSEMLIASTVYMWAPHSPLQKYMKQLFPKDSAANSLKRWASVAPLYGNYGSFLIRQYPLTYLQYYLLPNAIKYYSPPGEFLDAYNMGRDTVAEIAQNWFSYKTNKVKSVFKDKKITMLGFVPIMAGVVNVLFLFGFLSVWLLKGLQKKSVNSHILLLSIILWIMNFSFSVFASPITLRYQLFAIVIFTSFAWILLDHIYKQAFILKTTYVK
jgi:protoporphyrinogen oxidase